MRLAPGVDPQDGLLIPRFDNYVPLLRVRWGGDTAPSGWDVIPTCDLPVGTEPRARCRGNGMGGGAATASSFLPS